ncbi:MAG: dicarboxylate/amino acid:cation symporter [Mucispirillum sp.]|nr:dicarboxylate/amino acid:cation symporter [Mucispirillum sp.]
MGLKRDYLLVKISAGVVSGIFIGLLIDGFTAGENAVINIVLSVKHILGQVIFFMVPLIIIGFVTPAITDMKKNAGSMLGVMLILAYASSTLAAAFAMTAGYAIIPHLNIADNMNELKTLPDIIFKLDINPMFPVITALFFSVTFGLAIVYTNSSYLEKMFREVKNVVMLLVNKLIIPILPFFICATFIELTYTGLITEQLPVFVKMVFLVLLGHFIWLAVLYAAGGIIARKSPFRVLRHYLPAYLTAVGTMSSAATLPVALKCAGKSDALDKDIVNFAIPLGATIHLCGSVLTETFFVMGICQILTGALPPLSVMIIFILLLGIFAVGAPGVPGGTVMASIGIIVSVLGFDASGVALVMAIFALQDSFGTACNVTGDGALAMMLQGIFNRKKGGVSAGE